MSRDLTEARVNSLKHIAMFAAGGGLISFLGRQLFGDKSPATVSEIALTIGGTHFLLCAWIYQDYYGENISLDRIGQLLLDAGIVMAASGGAGYMLTQKGPDIAEKFQEFLGPLAGLAPSLVASSGVAIVGLAWMSLVDEACRYGGESIGGYLTSF